MAKVKVLFLPKVLPDGAYVRPARAQLSYGTMVFVRCAIAMDCARMLRKAVAIAVRYSAVRRQVRIHSSFTSSNGIYTDIYFLVGAYSRPRRDPGV